MYLFMNNRSGKIYDSYIQSMVDLHTNQRKIVITSQLKLYVFAFR